MNRFNAVALIMFLGPSTLALCEIETIASFNYDPSLGRAEEIAGYYLSNPSGDETYQWIGQSFTVEKTGSLARIRLWGYLQGAPNVDPQVDIYKLGSNGTLGVSLATAYYSDATIDGRMVYFPFLHTSDVILQSNKEYVWLVSLPGDTSNLDSPLGSIDNGFRIYAASVYNAYPGGRTYNQWSTHKTFNDFYENYFTIYANTSIPEPGTVLLLGLGGLLNRKR